MAGYIKERTKNAQFIVISLRNNMFELAERLVGIYKVNHMTKSVTVENRDYLAIGRQRPQATQAPPQDVLATGQAQQQQQPPQPSTPSQQPNASVQMTEDPQRDPSQ